MASTTFTLQKLIAKQVMSCFTATNDTSKKSRESRLRSRSFPFRRNSRSQTIQSWTKGDSYKDIKELTHGSEAKTSLTKSQSTGQVFVVKRFKIYAIHPSSRTASQPDTQPLPIEANLLMNVLRPHPNLLKVFGVDLFGGLKASVYSEFCNGGDLLEQSVHSTNLDRFAPEIFVLHVFVSLSNALAYLHNGLRWDSALKQYWAEPGHISILHADIKPENCFLRWSSPSHEQFGLPDVLLGDFGGAQPANNFEGYAGTDGYQAPEIAAIHALKQTDPQAHRAAIRKTGHMTPESDIFSLGMTMHMLCRGRLHVVGADPYSSPVRIVHDDGRRKSIGVDFSHRGRPMFQTEGLLEAVQWCLRPDPVTRPKMRQGSFFGLLNIFRNRLEELQHSGIRVPGAMWASLPGEME
ncbi:hypothetical protein Q7P37_005124 [Cladosporium fusiforme]